MERLAPTMFTSKTGERNRKNKIFVDYLRNGFGATAVAAFSPRWRPGVGVSTPVAWDEIDEDIRGTHFNLHNVPDAHRQTAQGSVEGLLDREAGADQGDDQENGVRPRFLKMGSDPILRPFISRCGTRRRRASPAVPRCTRTPTSSESL